LPVLDQAFYIRLFTSTGSLKSQQSVPNNTGIK
jgi:hypothetical protein